MLNKKEVVKRENLRKLYSMFDVKHYHDKLYMLCWDEDYCASDAIDEVGDIFADDILHNNNLYTALDAIDTYVAEAMKSRDWEYDNLYDICHISLEYVFDKYIGIDIVNTMVYNDCVVVVIKNNLDISQKELEAEYDKLFDYSYAYRETIYNIERYLKLKYTRNRIIDSLVKQLKLDIGDTFMVGTLQCKFTITKDGIISEGKLISQQHLLYILFGEHEIRKVDEK